MCQRKLLNKVNVQGQNLPDSQKLKAIVNKWFYRQQNYSSATDHADIFTPPPHPAPGSIGDLLVYCRLVSSLWLCGLALGLFHVLSLLPFGLVSHLYPIQIIVLLPNMCKCSVFNLYVCLFVLYCSIISLPIVLTCFMVYFFALFWFYVYNYPMNLWWSCGFTYTYLDYFEI